MWRHVPMTPAQAARCNAALAPRAKGDPKRWLSPGQVALHAEVVRARKRNWPVAIDVPLPEAWAAAEKGK
jgi:hypothetical protein